MIPKINRILYTTDLSKNSAYAFRYAVNSAEKHDSTIDILYVIASSRFQSEIDSLMAAPRITDEVKEDLKKKIRARLDAIVQRELKDRPEMIKRVSGIYVEEGDPTIQILNKAGELKSDLLIMGTHGKGLIAHTFLGSVATQVLQRTRLPVFIIPLPEKTDIAFED